MGSVAKPQKDNGTNGHRVLIVDDSPLSLQLLTHLIRLHGYQAETASSGLEALDAARRDPPDVILLDIMMPEMDGFEVAEALKADPHIDDIPIIFISALNDESSKVKAFDAGGVDYIAKPFQNREVLARVNTHVKLRDTTRRLEQQLAEREKLIKRLDITNEQLQTALARTEGLYRITRSLITSEDIPDMLQTVTQSVASILSCEAAFVVTVNLEVPAITFFARGGSGFEALREPSVDLLMAGLSGWVIKHLQPVLSPKGMMDPREQPPARRWREALQVGAMMVVPLYYRGRLMGTMTALNRLDQPDFTEEDLAQFSAIAGQVSVALANAQLSDETAYLKRFNEGIVQGVAEAILVTDEDERITFANPAAEAMLGYSLDALVGRPCTMLFPPELNGGTKGALVCRSGVAARFETLLQAGDGRQVSVLASVRPLYQDGEIVGSLAALTDITELKQAEDRLRQYAHDLEAQNAELDAFAHTVAHDLRSPLTGIVGFVDLLSQALEEQGDKRLSEYVHYIARSTVKMENIIDELLLLASVRAMDEITLSPLDMGRIVMEARDRIEYLIEEYGAKVTVEDGWPQTLGYAPWVEEVWVNYLSNAVKYGGQPNAGVPPRVVLGYDPPADGSTWVRFWVRDNGPGLAPEQQARLFTPFERLHNVRAEGHGLGLSIVRRIVEKLGGQVGVESTLGVGSTFYFTLPRA